jgi:hypothetical protein
MIDFPTAAFVFAASRQLRLIDEAVRRMTCDDSEGRLLEQQALGGCLAALRWLQVAHFAERQRIAEGIDELEHAIDRLARLGGGTLEVASGTDGSRTTCPYCRETLTTSASCFGPTLASQVPKQRWCAKCFEIVRPALDRLDSIEEGFAIDAI